VPFVPAATLPEDRPYSRRATWIFTTIVVLFLAAPVVALLPGQVNSVAWLTGAGRPDTFTGYVYGENCGRDSCTTVTYGTLASTGQGIAWPARRCPGQACAPA
jgi:hypothetical protein